jgi:hypothetical protein
MTSAEYRVLVATPDGDYTEETRVVAGPFYHGGSARMHPGDVLTAGARPNSWGDTFDDRGRSVYVYFTTDLSTAESYADAVGPRGCVYEIEPAGEIEMDNGGGDGAFRSLYPLLVINRIS